VWRSNSEWKVEKHVKILNNKMLNPYIRIRHSNIYLYKIFFTICELSVVGVWVTLGKEKETFGKKEQKGKTVNCHFPLFGEWNVGRRRIAVSSSSVKRVTWEPRQNLSTVNFIARRFSGSGIQKRFKFDFRTPPRKCPRFKMATLEPRQKLFNFTAMRFSGRRLTKGI